MISKDKMTAHHKRVHDEKLPFACQECGYRGLTEFSLQSHVSRYHSKKERILCEAGCGSTFSQMMSMRWHLKRYCKFSTVKKQMQQREDELGMTERRNKRVEKNKRKLQELSGAWYSSN